MGGAVGSGIVSITVIVSGISRAQTPEDVTSGGIFMLKCAMLLIPPMIILISYFVYRYKYKIDETMYKQILHDLKERGDIKTDD